MDVLQWDEFAYTRKVGKKSERDFLYFREWLSTTPTRNTSFFGNGRECKVKNGGRPCYQWRPAEVENWWNESGYKLGYNVVEVAQNVTAGDYYVIPEDVLETMVLPVPNFQILQPACSSDSNRQLLDELPCAPGNAAHLLDNTVVWQQMDSNDTMIDYMTRLYEVAYVDTVSILAVQRGNSFVPWPENADKPLLFDFVPGTKSASQMIDAASSSVAIAPRIVPWLAIGTCIVLLLL